jgi:hypothetical protein
VLRAGLKMAHGAPVCDLSDFKAYQLGDWSAVLENVLDETVGRLGAWFVV